MKYIISLTSVPSRFKNELPKVLKHIKDNSEVDIVLSIPKEYRKSWSWVDSDIEHLKELVTINIVDEDWGPATKLLGGIDWVKKNGLDVDGIITLDDDIIFTDFNLQLEHLLKTATEKPNTVITTGGLRAKHAPFRVGEGLNRVFEGYSHGVSGFMGVFYPKNFWKTDLPFTLLKELSDGFYSEDDAYFGAVAHKLKIKIWSTKEVTSVLPLAHGDENSAVCFENNGVRKEREANLYQELLKKGLLFEDGVDYKTPEVTFCLTSCGRMDELEKTVDSFIKYNDYPIKNWFIVEDSGDSKQHDILKKLNAEKWDSRFMLFLNNENIGQNASIDKMYKNVSTEYIFHCEEDWEFYRGGFIEDSMKVLETQPKVLQVWIRPKSDKILNPIEKRQFTLPGGVVVRRVLPVSFKIKTGIVKNYMGFSWNPGLRRKSDWLLDPISGNYTRCLHEHIIDAIYSRLGYMVVSLSKDDEDGYVKHIGWHNRKMGNTEATKTL